MTDDRFGIERFSAAVDQVAQDLPRVPLPCSPAAGRTASRGLDPKHQEAWDQLFLEDNGRGRRNPQWAFVAAAIFCHILAFAIVFPEITYRTPEFSKRSRSMVVRKYTPPPPPPKEKRRVVREHTKKIALPDMTPNEPEPIVEQEPLPEPPPFDPDVPVTIGIPEPPPLTGPLIPGLGGVTEPELVPETRIDPVYPELARRARIEGKVILQVIVRKDGTVSDISILTEPEANLGFSAAATAAVEQWRYRPAMQNRRAVDVFITVVVTFSLQ